MHSNDVPNGPWEKIDVDFFNHNGQKYLTTVDYLPKYPYLVPVKNTNAIYTINHLKDIFSIERVPSELMSDNRPPSNSSDFAAFDQMWNFTYVTSSPNYVQSNGQNERMIQTFKQMLSKCATGKQNLKQVLLQLRATPLSKNLSSPAEILQQWPARTLKDKHLHNQLISRMSKTNSWKDRISSLLFTTKAIEPKTYHHYISNRMYQSNIGMASGNQLQ